MKATAALLFTLAFAGVASAQADDDLQARIDGAIRRGREALMPTVTKNTEQPPGDYPMGRLALPLAAVLKAGAGSEDPIVAGALKRLETMPPAKTYGVACYLFALDALWQRKFKESVKTGSRTGLAHSRKARGDVRHKIVELVDWLVEARLHGRGCWNYTEVGPGGGRHDFSNSQFAVLGLQIGLEHDVPVPGEVFTEIAHQFLRSQTREKNAEKISITLSTTLEDLLAKTRVKFSRHFQQPPGGWSYTAKRADPYASMTAAGTSSLQVARNGLGAGSDRLRVQVEKALVSGYGWITKHFDQYVKGTKHYYYTLYSLEKVGDLGQIEKFGNHDWYVEGARELLDRQKENGTWGGYVDTSFALLFLTRATRLNTVAAPRIFTRLEGQGDSLPDPDLVYISRLDGFISARAVLAVLAESRRADLVVVGEEVVSNYRRDARGDLVPHLLGLWGRRLDRLTRFARESLEEITGERSTTREHYLEWHKRYSEIRALERQGEIDTPQLAKLLKESESLVLKARIIDLAHRRRLHALLGDLVAELARDFPAYRRKVHGILVLWSGQEIPAPADDSPAAWDVTIESWRNWWQENRSAFAVRRQTAELLLKLDTATGSAVERLVDELVGLGRPALPLLRAEMQREEYSFHLVEALERMSGKPLGLRPES